jgi:hypothetical protein
MAQGLQVMDLALVMLEGPFLKKLIGGVVASGISFCQGIMNIMITLKPLYNIIGYG